MKRTNLVLDGELLDQATRELGQKTYSATVNYALKEVLRMRKVERISEFFGSNLWEGDLSKMREDRTRRLPPEEDKGKKVTLVDTSIWIALLNGRASASPQQVANFVTCGPVMQEVLQGMADRPETLAFRGSLMALPCLSDPLPRSMFLEAAEIYRVGRRKGRTIRSPIDCLIAAIAIDNGVPLWHRDRDFDTIAEFTPLRISKWPVPRLQ